MSVGVADASLSPPPAGSLGRGRFPDFLLPERWALTLRGGRVGSGEWSAYIAWACQSLGRIARESGTRVVPKRRGKRAN